MPIFLYKARTKKGEEKRGEITATDQEVAAALLREHNLTPTSIVSKEDVPTFEKLRSISLFEHISNKEKTIFTRQFATMIKSGLPVVQSLKILAEQTANKAFKDALMDIMTNVEGGVSLSEAFAKFPKIFSKVYVALIKSGEASGNLDDVLLKLADQMERDFEIVSKIRGALYYPGFIFGAIIVAGVVMLIYVVPSLQSIFKESKVSLPWTTQLLINVSSFLANFWYLVIVVIIGAVVGLKSYINTDSGRKAWDKFKIMIPVFGPLAKKIYMVRFTRTLGTLVAGGIHILEALEITSNAVGNVLYKESILRAREQVENGVALAIPIKNDTNFPLIVSQMISVGEQTGKLDDILLKLAKFFDEEVDTITKALSSLIEPILIVIMGVAVAVLVASIIMPIYNLVEVI